jgi:hypothetical protein
MLPLGLSGCPPSTGSTTASVSAATTTTSSSAAGAALQAACAALFPKVAYLPLSVAAANEGRGWMPSRDASSGRVHRSPLQLSPGTLLLVDELTLGAGKLGEAGVRSLQALHALVQDQVRLYGCRSAGVGVGMARVHHLAAHQPHVRDDRAWLIFRLQFRECGPPCMCCAGRRQGSCVCCFY